MSNKLLEFKGLTTEFHTEGSTVKAVDNVSFTLNKGETVGIVGESGSGKSVTSLSAMRLIPSPPGIISGGEIIFHQNTGANIDLLKIEFIASVAFSSLMSLRADFSKKFTKLSPLTVPLNQTILPGR